jgi:hypothetical protein
MEASLADHEPAVRRLCVATAVLNGPGASAAAGVPGPLSLIQRSSGFYRLYLMTVPAEGIELAFAAPGLDEVSLVTDLITAMREAVGADAQLRRPVLAGFHVGITKVVGEGFGGSGADRTLARVRDPAVLGAAGHGETGARLGVTITAALFEDLRAEGLSGTGWQRISSAGAWLKLFDPAPVS